MSDLQGPCCQIRCSKGIAQTGRALRIVDDTNLLAVMCLSGVAALRAIVLGCDETDFVAVVQVIGGGGFENVAGSGVEGTVLVDSSRLVASHRGDSAYQDVLVVRAGEEELAVVEPMAVQPHDVLTTSLVRLRVRNLHGRGRT